MIAAALGWVSFPPPNIIIFMCALRPTTQGFNGRKADRPRAGPAAGWNVGTSCIADVKNSDTTPLGLYKTGEIIDIRHRVNSMDYSMTI